MEHNNNPPNIIRILFVGDRRSGKTQLSMRYVEGIYDEEKLPAFGVEFKVKTFTSPDTKEVYKIQVWDPFAPGRFVQPRTKTYYRRINGLIFVLDLTNPESFKFLKHELELAELLAPEHIQKILVGSKADDATNRKISDQEARDYAASQGMQYFEVSARADQNVTQAFETLLRLIEPVLHHWDNIDNTPVATRSGWCTLM